MKEVVIVAAKRTAIGKFGGSLAKVSAPELGATVIQALMAQTGVSPESIDEVILGQVLTAGAGQNPARQAVIKAGLPNTVSAMTINKVCGSGLKAVMLAAQAIACGGGHHRRGWTGEDERVGACVAEFARRIPHGQCRFGRYHD